MPPNPDTQSQVDTLDNETDLMEQRLDFQHVKSHLKKVATRHLYINACMWIALAVYDYVIGAGGWTCAFGAFLLYILFFPNEHEWITLTTRGFSYGLAIGLNSTMLDGRPVAHVAAMMAAFNVTHMFWLLCSSAVAMFTEKSLLTEVFIANAFLYLFSDQIVSLHFLIGVILAFATTERNRLALADAVFGKITPLMHALALSDTLLFAFLLSTCIA